MPSREHSTLPGYDGIVECTAGDDLVPSGISVWELSVEAAIQRKADRTFDERNRNSSLAHKGETTFVFATSRKWSGARKWVEERKESNWREVRVLWSQHMERWFERVPWLAAEFLDSMGEGRTGLCSYQMAWNEYRRVVASSDLDPDFVIAGRTASAEEVLRWLDSTHSPDGQKFRIAAGSHSEVMHFIIASVRRHSPETQLRLQSRMFVVKDEEAARSLGRLTSSHVVIVPRGAALTRVLGAQERSGCGIIIADTTPADAAVQPGPGIRHLHLGAVPESAWIRALMSTGLTAKQASDLCRVNGCDYERLRRAAFVGGA